MKKDFRKWVSSQKMLTKNSLNQYVSYLNYPALKFNIGGLSTIEEFYNNGDILYSLSYCDKMVTDLVKYKKSQTAQSIKLIEDAISAYKMLSLFLTSKKMTCASGDNLDQERKKITKSLLHKIDGIEGLIAILGLDKFVKTAVEDSFFFDPIIIQDRHQYLLKQFQDGSPIPARKTTKEDINAVYSQQKINGQWFFSNSGLSIPIVRDQDGNQNVRKIIKEFTGYSVGEGKGSIFKNYIISHIWGVAYDPRYFTSMWNIVLIPTWANSLMDKVNPDPSSLESKLQSTFQRICEELYFKVIKNWNGIQMPGAPNVSNPKDVINGTYNINIIGKVTNTKRSSLVAPITLQSITI